MHCTYNITSIQKTRDRVHSLDRISGPDWTLVARDRRICYAMRTLPCAIAVRLEANNLSTSHTQKKNLTSQRVTRKKKINLSTSLCWSTVKLVGANHVRDDRSIGRSIHPGIDRFDNVRGDRTSSRRTCS
jgi:hypothetical protein